MSSSDRNLNLSSKNSNDRPIIYKQLSLPGEREEELLELHTDDAIGYKFTVVHYQYSSGQLCVCRKLLKTLKKERIILELSVNKRGPKQRRIRLLFTK